MIEFSDLDKPLTVIAADACGYGHGHSFAACNVGPEVAPLGLPAVVPSRPIKDLPGMSEQTCTLLKKAGIDTIKQLAASRDRDLLDIFRFGPDQLNEVKRALSRLHR